MVNAFVTAFAGYQDLLYIDHVNKGFLINKNINLNNKQLIFLLSKNTLSMFLPNNGKVFGYSLFNNSMNACYNLLVKEDNIIPLKLNHNLVYNNGNTVIDSKSFKNFFYKNQVILSKITTLEDSNTTDTSSISSNESSSSSSSNMIDEDEKIVIFDDIQIKIKNDIILEIDKISFIKPIISDKHLKFYFECGHSKNNEENIFLFGVYNDLYTKNYYTFFKENFFYLSKHFIKDFKILVFYTNLFTLNNNTINWFIDHKIQNERNLLLQEKNSLEIDKSYIEYLSNYVSEKVYYQETMINDRNNLAIDFDNKNNNKSHTCFNKILDKIRLLDILTELMESQLSMEDEDLEYFENLYLNPDE